MTSKRLRRAMRLVAVGLMVAAVARELSVPRARRRWEGRILGIPYSFRLPTPARIRRSYWNPGDPRLFTERVFGLGWAVNLPQARRHLERAFRTMAGTATPAPATPKATSTAIRPPAQPAEPSRPSRSLTNSSARP